MKKNIKESTTYAHEIKNIFTDDFLAAMWNTLQAIAKKNIIARMKKPFYSEQWGFHISVGVKGAFAR